MAQSLFEACQGLGQCRRLWTEPESKMLMDTGVHSQWELPAAWQEGFVPWREGGISPSQPAVLSLRKPDLSFQIGFFCITHASSKKFCGPGLFDF